MEEDEINEGFNIFTKDIVLNIERVMLTLQQNEEKYLTSSSFVKDALSEQEKDDLDRVVKDSIQTLKNSIQSLSQNLATQKGFLKSRTTNEQAHKEVAISCLLKRLEDLAKFFKTFQKHRLAQQQKLQKLLDQEEIKSKMYKMKPRREDLEKNPDQSSQGNGANSELEQENQFLLKKYHNDQQKIQQLQSSILDIGGILDNLAKVVDDQKQTTSEILSHAEATLKYSDSANTDLLKAVKYSKDIGYAWSMLFFGLGMFLLAYDFLKS